MRLGNKAANHDQGTFWANTCIMHYPVYNQPFQVNTDFINPYNSHKPNINLSLQSTDMWLTVNKGQDPGQTSQYLVNKDWLILAKDTVS